MLIARIHVALFSLKQGGEQKSSKHVSQSASLSTI